MVFQAALSGSGSCLNANFSWCWKRLLSPTTRASRFHASPKVSHWFNNHIQKKKKNLSNWGLSVARFKCKPACLEHPHRSTDSMLKLEDWSLCQRQKKKTKKKNKTKNIAWFDSKTSETIFETSQMISPGFKTCFSLLTPDKINYRTSLRQEFSLVLGVCVHTDGTRSPLQPNLEFLTGLEAAAGFSRRWPAGHRLQASFKWEELLTPITYSPALQRLIFITSIILYNKYSNPDPKSRA